MRTIFSNSDERFAVLRKSGPLQTVAVFIGAVVLGLACGASVAFGPYWAGFALLFALAAGYALLRSVESALGAVVLVATVLPFATLPFKAVVTPNFLELSLIALFGILLLRQLTTPEATLELTPLGLPVIGFLGLTLFSFLLGSNGSPDSLLLHNYFKFVLGVLFFFGIVNYAKSRGASLLVVRMLLIFGGLSALVGLLLFALPDDLSLRILVSLGRFGYPTEGRVLRFVNDDTSGVERAIGLSVDPNSYGGMLALIGALAATQAVAERPVFRRWMSVGLALLVALVTFLTQSRGALGGLVAAALYVALVRYRKLLWPMLGAAVAGVVLYLVFGIGEAFVTRIVEGLQFRDLANQMRLAEFQNAIAVIQAYPVFGIGFGAAPQLDLVAGVSSIYLAMGQRIGLVGLGAFLLIAAFWFVLMRRATRGAFRAGDLALGSAMLGVEAAIVSGLAVGLLDHYFFNIEFSHMATLFWGVVGLGMALASQQPVAVEQE